MRCATIGVDIAKNLTCGIAIREEGWRPYRTTFSAYF
jgi:hypothetical protein